MNDELNIIISMIAFALSVASMTLNILTMRRDSRRRKALIAKMKLNSQYGKFAGGMMDVNSIYPPEFEHVHHLTPYGNDGKYRCTICGGNTFSERSMDGGHNNES